ncbi:MAG TPA: hypothetical protein EYP41_18350 [Anaerolineae bacterium]|nr:hypothetical protein [Anaerolineae bacterium]
MRHKNIWAGGLYALTATAVTWPAIRHLATTIPQGSESVPTVPLFNLWTLSWNVNRLLHGYQGYWDAPIFYPASGAFAFSDPQPLTGLLAAVFWPFGSAAAYNLILLLFLALNGWAAFTLLRHRGLPLGPALLGGLLVQMLPFLAHERGVLQLQPVFGVLWAVDGLWQLAERPRTRFAVQVGLGVAITFLTSGYYALFLVVLLATAVPFLPSFWRKRRFWTAVWPGILLAILFIVPVAWPQTQAIQAMGFSRSIGTITKNSATLSDYGRLSAALRFHHWSPWPVPGNQALFPGAGLLVMALLGSYSGLRQAERRRWTLYLLAGTAVAFLLSFGFNLKVGDWQPYAWLRDFVPGFDNLRSPFRWGYFVQMYLALLAALFLEALWRHGRRWRWVAVGLTALVLLELLPAPARLASVPPPLDVQALTPPLIFLPFPESKSVRSYADTAVWMAAASSVPMVNGYSGYFPQTNGQLRDLLADFPTFGGLEALRSLGVRTILIAPDSLTPAQETKLAAEVADGRLLPHPPLNNFLVYELPDAQFNPAANYTGQWALDVAVDGDELALRAYAAVPDTQIYVVTPVLAPLKWQVILVGEDGRRLEYLVSPPGTVLLYHDSNLRLPVVIPLPETAGTYTVTLQNEDSGEIVGKTGRTFIGK